jgi:hypothetical protein
MPDELALIPPTLITLPALTYRGRRCRQPTAHKQRVTFGSQVGTERPPAGDPVPQTITCDVWLPKRVDVPAA